MPVPASVLSQLKRRRLHKPDSSSPRQLCGSLSNTVARQLTRQKLSEEDVLEDFEASRKKRRAARRRR